MATIGYSVGLQYQDGSKSDFTDHFTIRHAVRIMADYKMHYPKSTVILIVSELKNGNCWHQLREIKK